MSECPKFRNIRSLDNYNVVIEKVPCEKTLSPGYAHCNDHITDTEFFAKHKEDRVEEKLEMLIRQIVGVEKKMAKELDGAKYVSLLKQEKGLRIKFGYDVQALPELPQRMNAHKLIKRLRIEAGLNDSGREPEKVAS